MARDISIAISAKDNFTQAITTMRNANQAFNKDITGLSTKLEELNKTKITLKIDVDKAKKSLKETEKAFADLGAEAGEQHVKDLQKANEAYEQARRNLKLVGDEARQTERALSNFSKESSKAENKAGIGSSGSTNMIAGLAAAGMTSFAGDIATNIAQGAVSSIFGSEASTIFSSMLSGGATGAAIGSLLPGLGTLAGVGIGAGLGLIGGVTSIYTDKDDAFKDVVQDYYDDVKQREYETLTKGIGIAGDREQKRISFTTLLGSADAANEFIDKLIEFDAQTPFAFDQLAEISRTLLAYGYKEDEMLPLLTKVGDAGSALGLSADEINGIATALGRMQVTGQTTMRYLNPLLEKGIDVWKYLADASGKTKEEVQEMVSKGLVPGAEAAKAIADYMGAEFAGNMEKQSKTYEGLISTLEGDMEELQNAMGEGYTEERKKGIEAQISWLEGESGAKMKEANKMIGEWHAKLDNDREAAIRKAIEDVMDDSDYIDAAAENNRVKMGQLLAEAQIKGENEYKSAKGYELQLETDIELVQKLRKDTALKDEYWNTGYIMGKEFSKGRLAGASANSSARGTNVDLSGQPLSEITIPGRYYGGKHAFGLNYVPYDNFPALLHEGERVLTASEARKETSPQVNITGNTFTIREEPDINKIAEALVKEIIKAKVAM